MYNVLVFVHVPLINSRYFWFGKNWLDKKTGNILCADPLRHSVLALYKISFGKLIIASEILVEGLKRIMEKSLADFNYPKKVVTERNQIFIPHLIHSFPVHPFSTP